MKIARIVSLVLISLSNLTNNLAKYHEYIKCYHGRKFGFKQQETQITRHQTFVCPELTDDLLIRNSARQLSFQRNGFTPKSATCLREERERLQGFEDTREHGKTETERETIKDVTLKLETFANAPLFANWKITGYTPTKVILSQLSNMETKIEASPDIVQFVKERDAAKEDMKKAQDELSATQSKLYDALQRIENLEKKVKEDESAKSKNKKPDPKKQDSKKTTTKKPSTQNGGPKANTATSVKTNSARTNTVSSTRTDGTYHPPVVNIDPCLDTAEYYWKVAEQFPNLPMFQILDAERKFIKADGDNSGNLLTFTVADTECRIAAVESLPYYIIVHIITWYHWVDEIILDSDEYIVPLKGMLALRTIYRRNPGDTTLFRIFASNLVISLRSGAFSADNSIGTQYIDKEELDKVLTETVTMFTPKQVDEIFKEIDTDNSETVDFYEVLVIINKLWARRKTNLPPFGFYDPFIKPMVHLEYLKKNNPAERLYQ